MLHNKSVQHRLQKLYECLASIVCAIEYHDTYYFLFRST